MKLSLPGRVTRGEGRCHVGWGRGARRGQGPDRRRDPGSLRTHDMRDPITGTVNAEYFPNVFQMNYEMDSTLTSIVQFL